MENCIILRNVLPAGCTEGLKMEEQQSKAITTTITGLSTLDGYVNNATMNGINITNQSNLQESQKLPKISILSSVASRDLAKISALQDMEKAWQESEADYFSRSCAWPKKSSPNSYSLKMSQQSQHEGDFESLKKLPKWGMIVDGVLYPLQALELYIKEKGGSYWPTPDASPRGAYKNKEKRKGHHFTLQDAIGSGKLNPMWVEWLMGYPSGWTELGPLEMQLYHVRPKKHLKFYLAPLPNPPEK